MKNFLFICGKNKIRSLTADMIFSNYEGLNVRSAGIDNDADNILRAEDLEWADYVFVMDESQRNKVRAKFRDILKEQKLIVLNIPDNYKLMQTELIEVLKQKVSPWIN